MTLLVARVFVAFGLFCGPLVIYIIESGGAENWLWMILALFGAVPAIVGALILFVPIEMALNAARLGYLKNLVVPIAGGSLIFVFAFVMHIVDDKVSFATSFERITTMSAAQWSASVLWIAAGAMWGVAWRASEWLAYRVGLIHE